MKKQVKIFFTVTDGLNFASLEETANMVMPDPQIRPGLVAGFVERADLLMQGKVLARLELIGSDNLEFRRALKQARGEDLDLAIHILDDPKGLLDEARMLLRMSYDSDGMSEHEQILLSHYVTMLVDDGVGLALSDDEELLQSSWASIAIQDAEMFMERMDQAVQRFHEGARQEAWDDLDELAQGDLEMSTDYLMLARGNLSCLRPEEALRFAGAALVAMDLEGVTEDDDDFNDELALRPPAALRAECHGIMALAHAALGSFAEGENLLREFAAQAPDDAERVDVLASYFAAMEREDEAEACYREALARNPDSAALHCHLGWFQYWNAKNKSAAKACFDKAIKLDEHELYYKSCLILLTLIEGEQTKAMRQYEQLLGDMMREADMEGVTKVFADMKGAIRSAEDEERIGPVLLHLAQYMELRIQSLSRMSGEKDDL